MLSGGGDSPALAGILDSPMAGLLEPHAFVWCIAGPHIGETLTEIVERKRQDIQEFGWCLWAYGGRGNVQPETGVRRLATEDGAEGRLPLLMPNTGKLYPDNGVTFHSFVVSRAAEAQSIPPGMSPVTGGRSSWAFRIASVEFSEDTVIDVGRYVAPYSRRGPQPLAEYLKGARGRACAALGPQPVGVMERRVEVVAELAEPYAVFLQR